MSKKILSISTVSTFGCTLALGMFLSSCSTANADTPPTPIDPAVVQTTTGGTPEVLGNVVKVSFPRTDIPVEIDGWSDVPPFMGLTSYASFIPDATPGMQAMVMGDVVLFEDEVSSVMSAALDNGLEVTALHNHFFFDKPNVFFMHIGGEGKVDVLGKGVKAVLDAQKAVRQNAPQPADNFGSAPVMTPSQIDGTKLDPIFGVTGTVKTGMYKATMGRTTTTSCCSLGAAMGVQTWAAFAGTDTDAVVDGDFAVTAAELQPVLKLLRAGGINIVAIHHHMTAGESPEILFLHYWGRGTSTDLATKIKKAVDLTAWDGHKA